MSHAKTVRKNLQHISAVVRDQKRLFDEAKAKIRELDGYTFWSEHKLSKTLAPFAKHQDEQEVFVTQEESDAIDMVNAELRVLVETLNAYVIFLQSAQTALNTFKVVAMMLEQHPGGIMPGKAVKDLAAFKPFITAVDLLPQEISVQTQVLEGALEMCGEGKITGAVDEAASAFVLLQKLQTFRKALGLEALVLIKSTTIQ